MNLAIILKEITAWVVGKASVAVRRNLWFVLTTLSLIIFDFVIFRSLLGYQHLSIGDLSPFPNDPYKALYSFLYSWNSVALGFPQSPDSSALITAILIFLFRDNAERILIFGVAPLSGICMYFLSKRLTKHGEPRYLISLLYAFNGFVLGEFLGGGFFLLFAYAIEPLVILFLIQALERPTIHSFLIFQITCGVAYMAYSEFIFIIAPFVVVLSIMSIARQGRKLRNALQAGLILGGWVIVSLMQYLYLGEAFFALVGASLSPPSGVGINASLALDTYIPYSYMWRLLFSLGVLIPMAIPAALVQNNRRYNLSLSLILVMLLGFTWMTANSWTLGLFTSFTASLIFENPVRPTMMIIFSTFPLAAISLDKIFEKVKSLRLHVNLRYLLSFVILGSVIASYYVMPGTYNYPQLSVPYAPPFSSYAFSGNLGLNIEYWNSLAEPISRFYSISQWLTNSSGNELYRTLLLPQYRESVQAIEVIDPNALVLPGGAVRYNLPGVPFVHLIYNEIASNNTSQLSAMLAMAAVKYVVIDKSANYSTSPAVVPYLDSYFLVGNPQTFVNIFDMSSGFKKVYSDRAFVIFENTRFYGPIAFYSRNSSNSLTSCPLLNSTLQNERVDVINVDFKGRTQITITIRNTQPLWVFLSYTYSPGWRATVSDTFLNHTLACGWANAFYLDRVGTSTIHIFYEPQSSLQQFQRIWVAMWLTMGIILVITSPSVMKRLRGD